MERYRILSDLQLNYFKPKKSKVYTQFFFFKFSTELNE